MPPQNVLWRSASAKAEDRFSSVQGEGCPYLDVTGPGFGQVAVCGDADPHRFAGAGIDE
jgi:hypothetical protein